MLNFLLCVAGDEVINLNNLAVYRKQVSEIDNLVQNR